MSTTRRHWISSTAALTGVAASLPAQPSSPPTPLPRIRVHPNGHYLQIETGAPFFWLGDTAWQLLQWLTWDQTRYYLATRARQGFNVIQVVTLAEFSGVTEPTAMGLRPFQNGSVRNPEPAFFDYLVRVVDEAARLGLYIALLPTWGDKVSGQPWGAGPRLFTANNIAEAQAYAHFLATRLRDRNNVLWMLGGDRPAHIPADNSYRHAGYSPGTDWRPIWQAMAAGLAEVSASPPLILFHPQGGEQSTSVLLPDAHWLSANGMQSGHGSGRNVPVWRWIARDYAATPPKPTLDLEPNYEDHPVSPWPHWNPANGYFRDCDVRRQAYRSVLAGACGVTYGHQAVWQFAGTQPEVINHADRDWTDALVRPGAQQMIHLRRLMLSRPYFDRIPAPEMLPDGYNNPDRANQLVATRDRNNTWVLIYFPNPGQPATLDLSALAPGPLRAWWFDPQTGIGHRHPNAPTPTRTEVRSPDHALDWVLAVEHENADLSPPGL